MENIQPAEKPKYLEKKNLWTALKEKMALTENFREFCAQVVNLEKLKTTAC